MINLWLDDERPIRDGFNLHVKTAEEAIELLKSGKVTKISLDHDLGSIDPDKTGYAVAKFIEEMAFKGELAPIEVNIHTANPVGQKNMELAVKNARKYWAEKEMGKK